MKRDEIRNLFESGALTWQQTMALLKTVAKPWHTPQWRNRRAEVIGDRCQSCGSQEPPLVLQHRWHPPEFSTLCELVKSPLREEYAQTHPYNPPDIPPFDPTRVPPPVFVERDCCPLCKSVAVRYRKRTNDWKCAGKLGRDVCGHECAQPEKRAWSRWLHEELISQALTDYRRIFREVERG